MTTTRERFEEKVMPVTETGCLLWTGAVSGNGYGNFWFGGRTVSAHIVAWYLTYGVWPTRVLDHRVCDTPTCVNVQHLRDVPQGENTHRGTSPSARNDLAFCGRGDHPWTEENIGQGTKGQYCKPCKTQRERERKGRA